MDRDSSVVVSGCGEKMPGRQMDDEVAGAERGFKADLEGSHMHWPVTMSDLSLSEFAAAYEESALSKSRLSKDAHNPYLLMLPSQELAKEKGSSDERGIGAKGQSCSGSESSAESISSNSDTIISDSHSRSD